MDNSVNRYRNRRKTRVAGRRQTRLDSVEAYRQRREQRLQERFDASARLAYGIAKSMGIKTEGMEPKEVWEAIRKKDPGAAAKANGGPSKATGGESERAASKTGAGTQKRVKSAFGDYGLKGGKQIGEHFLTNSQRHYDRAQKRAEEFSELTTYTDHRFGHVQMVMKKCIEGAKLVDQLKEKSDFYKSIDQKTLLAAAAYHDTGMDGGVRAYTNGNKLRKDHPINSAVHTLEDRAAFEKVGIDADDAAVLVIGHSKSSSGLKNLRDMKQWSACFDKIDEAVNEWNEKNPDNKITFNRSKYCDGAGNPDPSKLGSIAAGVAALRLGDANRDKPDKMIAQCGDEYKLDWSSYDPEAKSAMEEALSASASIVSSEGKERKLGEGDIDPEGYSRKAVYGESNINSMNAELDDGVLYETFEVNDGNLFPYCTIDAIKERVGELATMNGIPSGIKINIKGSFTEEQKKRIGAIYEAASKDISSEFESTMNGNGNENNGSPHGYDFKVRIMWDGEEEA